MSTSPFLIVPGFKGSGPDHWQTWLETQLPGSTRITGIDWDKPVLASWAERVRDELARATQPLRVVAHSFGCLATVVAVADRPEQVAELILVAPADPDRFDFTGLKSENLHFGSFSLSEALPRRSLHVRGTLIASRNDPWLTFDKAASLANDWGLDVHDAGEAGHINAASGHGAWPELLTLLQRSRKPTPEIAAPILKKGRGSTLAAVRQLTREQLEKPHSRKFRF
ncbi:MAG: alpha/beta hydrolase [Pseudomonadota bacterium]